MGPHCVRLLYVLLVPMRLNAQILLQTKNKNTCVGVESLPKVEIRPGVGKLLIVMSSCAVGSCVVCKDSGDWNIFFITIYG